MLGSPFQGLADTPDGFFDRCLTADFEAEIAGNRVNPGRIERNTTAVDCRNQLPGAVVVG